MPKTWCVVNDRQSGLPRVSVFMPVYNNASYVDEAISSVRHQTFKDFELVVVDDGSTDESSSIINRHAAEDGRIISLWQPNRGPTAAANTCISKCRGEFLARLDSDDIALPDRLQRQLDWMIERPEYVMTGCQVERIDAKGRSLGRHAHPESHGEIDRMSMNGTGGAICASAMFIRASAMKKFGGYDERYRSAEDLDLLLRMAEIGQVGNLPDVLVNYRLHPTQISTSFNFEPTVMSIVALEAATKRRTCSARGAIAARWIHASWQASDSGQRWIGLRFAVNALAHKPLGLLGWKAIVRATAAFMQPPRATSS